MDVGCGKTDCVLGQFEACLKTSALFSSTRFCSRRQLRVVARRNNRWDVNSGTLFDTRFYRMRLSPDATGRAFCFGPRLTIQSHGAVRNRHARQAGTCRYIGAGGLRVHDVARFDGRDARAAVADSTAGFHGDALSFRDFQQSLSLGPLPLAIRA